MIMIHYLFIKNIYQLINQRQYYTVPDLKYNPVPVYRK